MESSDPAIVTNLELEEMRSSMCQFQTQFDELHLKIKQLENVQHNLISQGIGGRLAVGDERLATTGLSKGIPKPPRLEPRPSTFSQSASSELSSVVPPHKEICRLDGRIDQLDRKANVMKNEIVKELSSWMSGLIGRQTAMLNSTSNDHEDDEDQVLQLEEDEEEDGCSEEDFEDSEPISIAPEILLGEAEDVDDEDDNYNSMESMDAMAMDQEDLDGLNLDLEYSATAHDEMEMEGETQRFLHRGQNEIEYAFVRSTGKHHCPFPLCTVQCVSRRNLIRHYHNSHASDTVYNCPVCGIGYGRKDNLTKHMKHKHPEAMALVTTLQVKPERPESETRVAVAVRAGAPNNTNNWGNWECSICKIYFSRRDNLMKHLRNKHPYDFELKSETVPDLSSSDGKTWECAICNISYGWKKNLLKHLRTKHQHQDEQLLTLVKTEPDPATATVMHKIWKCTFCEVRYGWKRNLTEHIRAKHPETLPSMLTTIEPGEFPLEIPGNSRINYELHCKVCQSTFSQREELEEHYTSCHDPKSISTNRQCPICLKTFTRRVHVERHIAQFHQRQKFKCGICGCLYSRKDKLHSHQRKEHGGESTCFLVTA